MNQGSDCMNVLLLGNGFDLYHKLPTRYINFLNTVNFIENNKLYEAKTVGEIFGNSILLECDKDISISYEQYKDLYDACDIDTDSINKLVRLANKNIWFSYFTESFNKDIGWIDFENEISVVINCFQELFYDKSDTVNFTSKTKTFTHIIKKFGFFIDDTPGNRPFSLNSKYVKDEFLIEYPLGSNDKKLNIDKVRDFLLEELIELADGLNLYLSCFIENILKSINKTNEHLSWKDAFSYVSYVITFNYTNTCEKLYHTKSVFHLHGNVNDSIVLGVNPDSFDDIETVDTAFITFKKYFQRIINKTDNEYLNWLRDMKETHQDITLFVIGHSLDITDKDILTELFWAVDRIFILNYNKKDEIQHLSNLVKILGKESFDQLRAEKELTFLPIQYDFTNIMIENADLYI